MAILFGKQYKEIDMTDIGEAASLKQQCHNQRLVDLFVDMPAVYRETWLTKKVTSVIEEDYKNRHAKPCPSAPLFVCVAFDKGPVLQYPSRQAVCDIASALQECSDWKPSAVIEAYLLQHCKIEHIVLKSVISRESASFADLVYKDPVYPDLAINKDGTLKTRTSDETVRTIMNRCLDLLWTSPRTRVKELDFEDTEFEKPTRFTDAPFKVIRDYLYACSFLSPYAPGFVDYANALLEYRLSYAISQEKALPAHEAIANLAREMNDFAKNHADGAWGLRAVKKMDLFGDNSLAVLTVRSDFGIITVAYEPDLTMVDWEKRYTELRTRYAGR